MIIKDADLMRTMYKRMLLTRQFENRHVELLETGFFPQAAHAGTGQEAVAIGITACLRPEDYLFPTHRGVGEYIGKGMSVKDIWAEYLGRNTGACRGKAGIHLADARVGIPGLVGSLGTDFSIAVGAALAFQLEGSGRVSCTYFGEGAAGSGDLGPALQMAALWHAPAIFACVNNQYAEMVHYRQITPTADIAPRAEAYGIRYEIIADGNCLETVYSAMSRAVEQARNGGGPTMLEFKSYRLAPHYTGDQARYQPQEEKDAWWRREPINRSAQKLLERGWATDAELKQWNEQAAAAVELGLIAAREDPEPEFEELWTDVSPAEPWGVPGLHG